MVACLLIAFMNDGDSLRTWVNLPAEEAKAYYMNRTTTLWDRATGTEVEKTIVEVHILRQREKVPHFD